MSRDRGSRQRVLKGRYRVFVSHATADKFLAVAMCKLLESAGIETFRDDRDIAGGDDIPDVLRDAIEDSDEVVVLLTSNSVDRAWVILEIGAAWAFRKTRVVPILYNVGVDPIPAMLKSKKAIQLNDFQHYIDEVVARKRGEQK